MADSMNEIHNSSPNRAVRLIEYLIRLAHLRSKIVRDIEEYTRILWLHEIPKEKNCFTQAWGASEDFDADVWIEVKGMPDPPLPKVPEICQEWVNLETLYDTSNFPELLQTTSKLVKNPTHRTDNEQPEFISVEFHLDKYPSVQRVWEKYVEQEWMPWAESHDK